jgi:hypothetical protein
MGCDIHLYVERFHPTRQEWVPVKPQGLGTKLDKNGKVVTDWDSWAAFIEPESELKQLADAGQLLEDVIPESHEHCTWAFWRNYEAFGQLAGVRGREEPFIAPRGLPDDLSSLLIPYFYSDTEGKWKYGKPIEYGSQTRWGDPDLHSAHHYDLYELEEALHSPLNNGVDGRIAELIKEMRKIAKLYNLSTVNVRVVFAFDN